MFVHTATSYQPEDYFKNKHPIIVFDNDTDNVESSTTWALSGSPEAPVGTQRLKSANSCALLLTIGVSIVS